MSQNARILGYSELRMKQFRHNFTLLEILVAVAVLVIMMGFLFQFVISAQRVWASSTARTQLADQANTVFQLLSEDFNQMITINASENPDSVIGWYCDPDPKPPAVEKNLNEFCFFGYDRDDADGALYGVMYFYLPKGNGSSYLNGRLYRIRTNQPAWHKIGTNSTPNSRTDFDLTGSQIDSKLEAFLTDSKLQAFLANPESETATEDLENYLFNNPLDPDLETVKVLDGYLVAEKVSEFIIRAAGDTSTTVLPRFLRVTMKIQVPDDLANTASGDQVMDRTFSRVFFFGTGK